MCGVSSNQTGWPFKTDIRHWPSCMSSAGRVNDLDTTPQMCEGDLSSVRIELTPGKAECLVAEADCRIPMNDFVSLDYDFQISRCNGAWAAPLWLVPETWQWYGNSGEVDSLEFCPRTEVHSNFAGGGHAIDTGFFINRAEGHVTVRKDAAGIITTTICTYAEANANGGQCPAAAYTDCDDCMGADKTFACWCLRPDNIYSSGGCQEGTSCMWTLVSDIWNGVHGDAGYYGCMTETPGVASAGQPNLNSQCTTVVEKIVLRGGGPNGALQWGAGSSSMCAALTV